MLRTKARAHWMATRPLAGSAPITPRSSLLSDVSAAAQSTSSSPVTGETQRMAAQKVMLGRWRTRPVSRAIQAGEASRQHLGDCFIFFLPYVRSTTTRLPGPNYRCPPLLYRLAICKTNRFFLEANTSCIMSWHPPDPLMYNTS